jgi:hypothetical protein
VAVESAVFVLNGGICPLTPLAERHGAARGSVSDIFLPDAVARTIPAWSTVLVALAFGLHLRAWLRSRGGLRQAGVTVARGREVAWSCSTRLSGPSASTGTASGCVRS